MKKFLSVFVVMFPVIMTFGQTDQPCIPCLQNGVLFTTQAQIDNFQSNYPNCTSIPGGVQITGPNITNLNGLSTLTHIGLELLIGNNPQLTSLAGLNGLTSCGELFIDKNPALISLSDLSGLTSMVGDLTIVDNISLTSLSGLDNLNSGTIYNIYISGNSSLSTCDVMSICNYLVSLNGAVNIYGNAPGCNNPPEVASGCGISLPCLPHGNYHFLSQSDIDNFQSGFTNCTHLTGNVYIRGGGNINNLNGLSNMQSITGSLYIIDQSTLTNFTGLNALTTIGSDLYIRNNTALMNLTGLESLATIPGLFLVQLNPALTSFAGLGSLKSIGGDLYFNQNSTLTSLTGLDSLTTIGGALGLYDLPALISLTSLQSLTYANSIDIINNDALTSLSGLDNINANTIDFLSIYTNNLLSTCNVQSVCAYLQSHNYSFNIYGNAYHCNSDTEIEKTCATIGIEPKNSVSSLTIYPNPTSDNVIIETKLKGELTLLTLNGQPLFKYNITEQSTKIDISKLASGVYILKLIGENGMKVEKLFKE